MVKKILFLFMMLMLIGLTSALEFDNVKSYNPTDRIITIQDSFLGIPTSKVAEIKLDSPLNVYVMHGRDRKVAEFTINLFENGYSDALKEIEFYDANTAEKIGRTFRYKYKTIVKENQEVMEWVCQKSPELLKNGSESEDCILEKRDILVEKEVWNDYLTKDLSSEGNITIGIFTDVKDGDYVEWIPTFFGVKIEEWATWTDNFNNRLLAYYKFDATTFYNDSLGKFNGTKGSAIAPTQVAGKIGNAYEFEGDSYINLTTDSAFKPKDNFTINMWVRPKKWTNGNLLAGTQNGGTNIINLWGGAGDTNAGTRYEFIAYGQSAQWIISSATSAQYSLNRWDMITISVNSTEARLFVNGTFIATDTSGGGIEGGLPQATIAGKMYMIAYSDGSSNAKWNGTIDEVGFWNRSLSASEISDLYNGGTGITYTETISTTPISVNSTLVAPANASKLNYSNVLFRFNVSITNLSLTNYTINIWNSTGSRINYSTNFNATTTSSCYQETANASKAGDGKNCDLNYSGSYSNFYITEMIDGDWSTGSSISAFGTNFSVNYTKPNYFLGDTAIWQIKSNPTGDYDDYNITINKSCLRRTDGQVRLRLKTRIGADIVDYYCYNDTNEVVMTSINYASAPNNNFYEEAILWGVYENINYTYNFTKDGNYLWGVEVSGDRTGNGSYFRTVNWSLFVDVNAPILTLNSLNNVSTTTLPVNVTLNVTTTHGENIATCEYWTSDNATHVGYTCNTTINIQFATGGNKNITVFANDTIGNWNEATYFVSIFDFNITQYPNLLTIIEGGQDEITLIINSTSFPIGDSEANLYWNGTNKGKTTETALNTYTTKFVTTFPIYSGYGNSTGIPYQWWWSYNATHLTNRNTTNQSQSVMSFAIDNCSIYTIPILNLTLKNEELNQEIGANISSLLEVDINISGIITNSYWNYSAQFINKTHIQFCVPADTINFTNYTIKFTFGFSVADYVQEFYFLDNGSLSNTCSFNSYTSCNINLMDLLTADSTTFLFEYIGADGLEVEDAIVHVYRRYIGEGIYREIERAKQDNNGQTHVHLVEEDVIYYFMITQEGRIIFTSSEYNAKCLSTPCELTLSGSPTATNWSVIDNEGGKYAISTDIDTRVTTLTFSIETADLVNYSVYEVNSNGVSNLINTSSLTALTGTIPLTIPLSYGNKTYFVEVWRDNYKIKSTWISLTESARDYFGTTGAILGGLVVLTIALMAVAEGIALIIFTIFAVVVIVILQLVDMSWASVIALICAGAIIVFKLVKRRRRE